MSSLYELIHRVQKRPSMYLGKASVCNLRSCLAGYIIARRELGIPQTDEERNFVDFEIWIQKKFNVESSQSWDKIILFYSEDERTALERFFDLFEEFIQENNLVNNLETTNIPA